MILSAAARKITWFIDKGNYIHIIMNFIINDGILDS